MTIVKDIPSPVVKPVISPVTGQDNEGQPIVGEFIFDSTLVKFDSTTKTFDEV